MQAKADGEALKSSAHVGDQLASAVAAAEAAATAKEAACGARDALKAELDLCRDDLQRAKVNCMKR
jgi:hypothetical protein